MLDKLILAPYYLTLKLRHACYDHGFKKVSTSEVPTICVGNITAGGTGKTPHTEMILRSLLRSDDWAYRNIAVLSRGHKRNSGGFQLVEQDGTVKEYGDEPLQIKKKFPGVTVAVDRHRVKGCSLLCHPENLGKDKRSRKCAGKVIPPADLIVLDDAFQYRALRAYYTILLVDYSRPTHEDMLLPFGRLRDLPERMSKGDIIIVSKCPHYLEDEDRINWAKAFGLKDYDVETCRGTDKEGNTKILLFTAINYQHLKPIYEEADPRFAYPQMLVLFTGIAKDTPLRMYLSDKHRIIKRFKFADHHNYKMSDIRRIMRVVDNNPTCVVATTEKDCQRILDMGRIPAKLKQRLFQVPIEVDFLTDHEREIFETTLMEALRNFTPEY
ncbi:MAG: tetraacyldisaccharide 4'-kinase [Bacteroidales bacterium]|nr:tetraacyldisaccharide 4'-kinase [Candidatus Cryptobacteroides faecihippi]